VKRVESFLHRAKPGRFPKRETQPERKIGAAIRIMARIGVLTFTQTTEDQPEHFVSAKLAEKFLAQFIGGKRACVRVAKNVIKIVVHRTFQFLKSIASPRAPLGIPKLKTDVGAMRAQNLLLYYPVKNQQSFA
jgi:hypothetical protein